MQKSRFPREPANQTKQLSKPIARGIIIFQCAAVDSSCVYISMADYFPTLV
ncbi:hypothetical protein QYF53_20335 [Paenibacillus polymyxa]|nr:hypothetical protein [Paenibacillus polymyxa]